MKHDDPTERLTPMDSHSEIELLRRENMELKEKATALEAGRDRVMEALRESEETYRLIAEHTADTIWIADMDLRFTYVSPSVFRMYGTTVEEVMGRGLGLPLVEGIVTALGGAVRVETAPGKGSAFRVFLPVHAGKGRRNSCMRNDGTAPRSIPVP